MKKINHKQIISGGATVAVALSALAFTIPAFADTSAVNVSGSVNVQEKSAHTWGGGPRGEMGSGMIPGGKPVVFGTVSSISGNTIVVSGRQGPASTSVTTTFTIDATNATIRKDNATSTLSGIAVGDTVVVQGTLNGTNVIATNIRDGLMRGPQGQGGEGFDMDARNSGNHRGDA